MFVSICGHTDCDSVLAAFLYLPEPPYLVIFIWLFFLGPGWLSVDHWILCRHRCAQEIAAAFHHFDGTRINIVSFVVMPNHVHALFAPMHEWPLEKIVHSWKRQSAVRINRLTDSTGALWQRDYFDRLVRNEQHFARCVRYIRSNPEKARLRPGEYILYESDIARAVGEAV